MASLIQTNTLASSMPTDAPPFSLFPQPGVLPEAALARLPLSKLQAHNAATESELLSICRSQGFFYLDLTESTTGAALLSGAEQLHGLAQTAFRLPTEEKEKISMAGKPVLFGWKRPNTIAATDPHRRPQTGEFFCVAKDDVVQNAGRPAVAYPAVLADRLGDVYRPFVEQAHATGLLVLRALARGLELDPEALAARHRVDRLAGDHVRMTYAAGDSSAAADASVVPEQDEATIQIQTWAHTDFGSVTLLFNWLGGLQIENSATGAWEWVRPLPGHAICNMGDAMVKFTGGRLRSGKHRVVNPPGAQARSERYSLVYFVRPNDDVIMENLIDGEPGLDEKRWPAGEWIAKRAREMGSTLTLDEDEDQGRDGGY